VLVVRRPVVLTLHCSARATYVARSRLDSVVQVATRLAERLAVRAAASTLVLTERTRAFIGAPTVEVMADCVPAGFAAVPEARAVGTPPQALFLARVSAEKGWPDLIELARRLHGRGLRIRAVGGGPDLARFRAAAEAAGMADRIDIEGELPAEQIPAALAASDVVVLPSQHEELGSALIEAMAAGVPGVAYAVGGVAEVIRDGVTGVLVAPGDVPALARAVARALDDEALRSSARTEGPRLVEERYSAGPASRRLVDLYGRLAGEPQHRVRLTVLVDHYPALSETFVVNEIEALERIGHDVHVESAARAEPRAEVDPRVPVHCLDDDGLARRARDLLWLIARHPDGVLADLRDRRRWRSEETVRPLRVLAPMVRRVARRRTQHLHAHFAAGAALDALRTGRLLGLPYSVMAHAYDIYRSPRNLSEKLQRAAFAAGECEYSVVDLRKAAGTRHADRVHVVTMGVEHQLRFRRQKPYPGGRSVLAVGRLVEKKGFRHLLDAAALMAADAPLERLRIIGDGPLRAELEEQADALGLGDVVEWLGARTAGGVRDALEDADVLVVSAVFVDDGDRDVLPLIVGEALAMEVPVIASDMVGLPELVMPPWGTVVPPGDARALADALSAVLALPAGERTSRGRSGREFVVATRDLETEARKLADLIRAAGPQIIGTR
jgi:colanic acid/amylovoran biosynthesis glycosyltransferase